MNMSRAPLGAVLTLCLLLSGPAQAVPGGLYLDLLNVPGESTDEGHENWIKLDSVSWAVGRPISLGRGDREVGPVSASDFSWQQRMDTSVPLLIGSMLKPKLGVTATFDIMGSSGDPKAGRVVSFDTKDSAVTSVSAATDHVSASLGYKSFTLKYDLNAPGPEFDPRDKGEVSYDLSKAIGDGPTLRKPAPYTGKQPAAAPGGETALYLRLGDGNMVIAGDAQAKGYENWIRIDSAQWGVGLSYDPARGLFSKPSFSELTWTQTFDAAAAVVLSDLLQRREIGQSTLEYVRDAGAGPVTFMQLALDEVMFSGLSLSTSGGDIQVSASMAFTAYHQTVWEILPNGLRGEKTSVGFDLATGEVLKGELARVPNGFGAGSLQATLPLPVPEPGSWAMLAAGLGVLLTVRRRRDRAALQIRPAG